MPIESGTHEPKNIFIREDVDRLNEIERLTRVELPDLPSPEVLGKELEAANKTMKAIWDTLCIDFGRSSKESQLLQSTVKVCAPFRSLLVTTVEHCRGVPAAIVGRRKRLDHLYWMGGYHFCPGNPTTAGTSEPYMDSAAVVAAGWPTLGIVGELRVRLMRASFVEGKFPTITTVNALQSLSRLP